MDAAALYALAPEQFTAARDAAVRQARADGDGVAATALKALRRPSVSAWLVNRLAADHRGMLEELLALGAALGQAQSSRQAGELRELGRQRRALVEAVADTALESRRPSAAVRDEVVATLEAALADPASADAVRSGRLVRALSYAGFGGVDLSGAVAGAPVTVPAAGRARSRRTGRAEAQEPSRAAVAAAEALAQAAAGRLDDAVSAAASAEREAARAVQRVVESDRTLTAAASALAAAQAEQAEAVTAGEETAQAWRTTGHAVTSAQDAAERARAALDALRRGRQVSGG